MFDWSYFDNSKVIMFDDWKVLFLRKILTFELIGHNQGPDYVRLILILTFYVLKHVLKTTHS
jgi:hypothetical protein